MFTLSFILSCVFSVIREDWQVMDNENPQKIQFQLLSFTDWMTYFTKMSPSSSRPVTEFIKITILSPYSMHSE